MALMDEATGARRAATVVATEEAHTLVISKSLYNGVLRVRQQMELREKVRAHLLPENSVSKRFFLAL